MPKKRNYKREYDKFHGKSVQKKRRALRNNANRAAKRAGTIKKGQEIDHKVPLRSGGSNNPSNLRAVSRRTNRKKG